MSLVNMILDVLETVFAFGLLSFVILVAISIIAALLITLRDSVRDAIRPSAPKEKPIVYKPSIPPFTR